LNVSVNVIKYVHISTTTRRWPDMREIVGLSPAVDK